MFQLQINSAHLLVLILVPKLPNHALTSVYQITLLIFGFNPTLVCRISHKAYSLNPNLLLKNRDIIDSHKQPLDAAY